MQIKPLTQELFGKQNIREVVREWVKDYFEKEVIEHNIEWFESLYYSSLRKIVLNTKEFYISEVCYKKLVKGEKSELVEEYKNFLAEKVKDKFFSEIYSKELSTDLVFEEYVCLKTENGFYEGEIYKYFSFLGDKGVYGYKVDLAGKRIKEEIFNLVHETGDKHLVVNKENFRKL